MTMDGFINKGLLMQALDFANYLAWAKCNCTYVHIYRILPPRRCKRIWRASCADCNNLSSNRSRFIHSCTRNHWKKMKKTSNNLCGEIHTQNTGHSLAAVGQDGDLSSSQSEVRWQDLCLRGCDSDFPIAHRAGACSQLQNISVYVAEINMSYRIIVHHLIEFCMTNMYIVWL